MKQFVLQNMAQFVTGGAMTAVLIAFARNMPKPGAPGKLIPKLYKWGYDTIQTLVEKPKE